MNKTFRSILFVGLALVLAPDRLWRQDCVNREGYDHPLGLIYGEATHAAQTAG